MTTLIASSVLRIPRGGERQEGVYLMDLDRRAATRVMENKGAGAATAKSEAARVMRAFAFDAERVFIASSDELLAFSPAFEPIGAFRCPYLKDCEDISVHRRRLFLTSAGYDSILGFDLDAMRFSFGLHLHAEENGFRALPFDPNGQKGPRFADNLHLDSVHCNDDGMFVGGVHTGGLLRYGGRRIELFAGLPRGAHDARPWRGGVLFNDSQAGVVRYVTPQRNHVFRQPRIPADSDVDKPLRGPLGRGLCVVNEGVVASGSSPSTITLHDVDGMQTTLTINLSMNAFSAIRGLAVWPFRN